MFASKKHKEPRRFYLLPGMGGRNLRRKRRRMLAWSIVAALVFSVILAGFLYWVNQQK